MFFLGFAFIAGIWFIGSLARSHDLRSYRDAGLFALVFIAVGTVFIVGLALHPAAAAEWGTMLAAIVFVTFAVVVVAGERIMMKKAGVTGGGRGDSSWRP